MRKLIIWLSIFLMIAVAPIGFASTLIEVNINGYADLRSLQTGGFDIVYMSDNSSADVLITDGNQFSRLAQLGLSYQVIHEDLEKFLSDRLQPSRDDMGGYRTFDEIEAELFQLFEDFDHIISEPISIGESIEDRPIWAIKISDNPEEDEDEAELLFTAATHAREVITPEVLFGVINALVEGYGNDDYITNLVDERQIWFILCVNPDGYVQNEEDEPDGGGLWRKNKRENEDGSIGVDLNRNWGWEWGYDDVGSSPRGRDATYRGTEAFSEPETQGLREFINAHEFTIVVNFHGYGDLALYPWGYDYIHCPDLPLFTALARKMTEENGYLAGTGWETIYLVNGESDDWIYGSDEHNMILSFTPEVGTRNDNFWPARNRVETLVNDNIGTCLTLIDFAELPARALTPPTPENVTFHIDNAGDTHISWEPSEDEINPAEQFEIMGRIYADAEIDVVEIGNELWDPYLVTTSGTNPHSGPRSYLFNVREPMSTLTYTREILAPDSLWSWIRYDLSLNNNFALEITTDGNEWIAAPGRDTEDVMVEGYNHGPGLFRDESDGWQHHWWDLSDWDGQMIRFRFRYYEFGRQGRNDFVYIDDIGPLPVVEWEEVLAEGLEDLEWVDEENDPEDGIEYYVRSIDAEGDASFWSAPAIDGEGPPGFELFLVPSWSMISSPVDPDNPRWDDLFAGLIEHENLFLIKDGRGVFFNPRYIFEDFIWDPLQGYLINMLAADSLFFAGERMPVDTPLILDDGWSLIPYYPEAELPAEEALASIAENIIIVKNDQGRFWSPEFGFNNMADLQIGQAYQIKLDAEDGDTLIYPVDDEERLRDHSPNRRTQLGFTPPSPFNHSIILQMKRQHSGRIVMRDRTGEITGMAELDRNSDQLGIAAWGQSENSGVGYAKGDSFNFYWQDETGDSQKLLGYSVIAGDENWVSNGISVIELDFLRNELSPDDYGLISSYPNPFNGKVKLTYRLEEGVKAQIVIYNSVGAEVYTVSNLVGTGYENHFTWDASNISSGLYFARISTAGHGFPVNKYLKLLLIR